MSDFHPSSSLRPPLPTSSAAVASTASTLSPGVESHPQWGKYYSRNYGVGRRSDVRSLTRRSAPENRYACVKFRTTAGGRAPIAGLDFAGGGSGSGSGLAVAGGPRVSLYGGAGRTAGTSDFARALKAGSAAQRRRDDRYDGDDDDDGSVDLFGGKFKKKDGDKAKAAGGEGEEEDLDPIDADRNVSTGGLLAECASHRSDGKLIAIGTEGGSVRICDANSRATLRTFGSAKDGGGGDRKSVRGVAWLRDGKRVVAGGDDGLVRVWSGSGGGKGGLKDGGGAMCTLRGHGDRVTSVAMVSFRRDDHSRKGKGKKRSHDGSLGASPEESCELPSEWGQLAVSGSYDHTVRVWDVDESSGGNEDRCLSVMDHGDPVQALLVLPPSSDRGREGRKKKKKKKASKLDGVPLLVSAGGTTLKVWNPLNGSCLGTFATKHAKTISSLCLLAPPLDDGEDDEGFGPNRWNERHIVTGGLDGLLRVHSASNADVLSGSLPYLHGMRVSHPISALAASRDSSRIAIGTTSGIVIVHQRRRPTTTLSSSRASSSAAEGATSVRREPRHGTYAHFTRGAHERSHDPDDYLLAHHKRQRLAEYDVLLRRFRYGEALDAALKNRQPQAVIAVIEELGKRRGLSAALSDRDEESLDSILSFTVRFIDHPQYGPHLVGVANLLCDVYGSLRGQSAAVDELFTRLGEKVAAECATRRAVLRLLGQIDLVMAGAEAAAEVIVE